MTSSDLKKLIAGFLLFAAITGSVSFMLSTFSRNTPSLATPESDKKAQNEEVRAPKSAFVESLPPRMLPLVYKEPAAVQSKTNFTDALIDNLVGEVAVLNPKGPERSNGKAKLEIPDIEETLLATLKNAEEGLAPLTWSEELRDVAVRNVKDSFSAGDIAAYRETFDELFEEHFVRSGATRALDDPAKGNPEALRLVFDQALKDAADLAVPQPLVEFHKSFLKLLAYGRNALGLAERAKEDPLKIALLLKSEEKNFELAIVQFENELRKVRPVLGSLDFDAPRPGALALFTNLFGVERAHALFGIGDIVHDPPKYIRDVWEWVRTMVTSRIRDRLIHRLVTQTVRWIQGGGKPQFITDFRGFLGEVANAAAGDIISRRIPRLCTSFGPLIRIHLEAIYLAGEPPVTCTLTQVLQNAQDFLNDFTQGGWIGYGTVALPGGNFFGTLFEEIQITGEEERNKKDAAREDAAASGGFKSQKECVQTEIRNQREECMEAAISDCSELNEGENIDQYNQCVQNRSEQCEALPDTDKEFCIEERVTTPGRTLADIAAETIGHSPIASIVNAQDIKALVSALINAALNKLLAIGQRGLLGLVFPPPEKCERLTGQARIQCETEQACKDTGLTGQDLELCLNPNFSCRWQQGQPTVYVGGTPVQTTSTKGSFECTGSAPTSTESGKCGPNPEPGCRCTGPGGEPGLPPNDLSESAFNFREQTQRAQDAVEARACTEDVGVVCEGGAPTGQVNNGPLYVQKVAEEVSDNLSTYGPLTGATAGQGDEVWVKDGSPQRSEHYAITTSFGTIRNTPIAICIPPRF